MTDKKPENGQVEGDSSYGGLEGPEAEYIKLISNDGYEFVIKREHAMISGTINAMLTGPGQFAENETNTINFKDIPSYILEKGCTYFAYKHRYEHNLKDVPDFPIDPKIALDLLMAANFLDC